MLFRSKRADEIGFDQVQMIQDDKNRWALYLKPEHQSGYSIYPDKDDLNRFFSTLKQSMDNIENVRMELAHKYYALAETQPDLKVDLFSSGAQDIGQTPSEYIRLRQPGQRSPSPRL